MQRLQKLLELRIFAVYKNFKNLIPLFVQRHRCLLRALQGGTGRGGDHPECFS